MAATEVSAHSKPLPGRPATVGWTARQRRIEAWLVRAEDRPLPWLLALALLLAVQISPLWYASPDGAAYLSIARSIAHGVPMTRFGSAELSYPAGYPLLISPAFLVAPRPFVLLSIVQWAMGVLFALGVYCWMRRTLGVGALWLTALVMANATVWTLNRSTLSEPAFLTLMIWTINALDAVLVPRRAGARQSVLQARLRLAAAAIGLIALASIREVGVFAAAGFVLAMLARAARGEASSHSAGAALMAGAAAVLIAFVVIRPERIAAAGPALAGNLSGYLDAASAVGGGLGQRMLLRVTELGQLLVPGMAKAGRGTQIDVATAIFGLVFIAVAVGWWRLLRRRGDVFVYAAPVYFGFLLVWPYAAATRYVVPLLPLLAASLWTHVETHRQWRLTAVAALAAGHLIVALGYWGLIDLPRARVCARQWPTVERLATAIAGSPGEVTAAAVMPCVRLMLAFELDRPVRAAEQSPGSGDWLVAGSGAAAMDGYRASAQVGDYTLLRRLSAP